MFGEEGLFTVILMARLTALATARAEFEAAGGRFSVAEQLG